MSATAQPAPYLRPRQDCHQSMNPLGDILFTLPNIQRITYLPPPPIPRLILQGCEPGPPSPHPLLPAKICHLHNVPPANSSSSSSRRLQAVSVMFRACLALHQGPPRRPCCAGATTPSIRPHPCPPSTSIYTALNIYRANGKRIPPSWQGGREGGT